MTNDTRPESPTQEAALRNAVDFAFDAFIRSLSILPYGKSNLRRAFQAGWAAARGEQPCPPRKRTA